MAIAAVLIEADGVQITLAGARAIAERLHASNPDLVIGCLVAGEAPAAPGDAAPSDAAAEEPAGSHLAFVLSLDRSGLAPADPRRVMVGVAAAGCFPRDAVLVAARRSDLVDAADAVGCEVIVASPDAPPAALVDALAVLQAGGAGQAPIGVGPHPQPWPDDPRLDPQLLEAGDRRNVEDHYRYWSEAAIIADLESRRSGLHVAIENWQHDLNIGTVVRNANAFNVAAVHIVGKRRWNRRGAMATDRYLTVHHHPTVEEFADWCAQRNVPIVGVDNIDSSVPLEQAELANPTMLVFGQEGPGLSDAIVQACDLVVGITQHGSTRSLNAGVASGVAMYAWTLAWPQPGRVP